MTNPRLAFRSMPLLMVALCMPLFAIRSMAQGATDWKMRIESARQNQIVVLPEGEFTLSDVTIPLGVEVRGAGYNKTIVNAGGGKVGFTLSGRATLSNLTVRNARENGVHIGDADSATVKSVRIEGSLTGLLVERSRHSRAENLVLVKNRTGASLTSDTACAVINCTLVGNSAVALAVSRATDVAVFNNLFLNSPTGAYLAADNRGLSLDHNLYLANYIGKLEGEVARTTLPGWQRVSGLDQHSVFSRVEFADEARGDFRPVNALAWDPTLSAASGWGASTQLGFTAPRQDITGHARTSATLGAFEATLKAPAPPDGTFTIDHNDVLASAGIYSTRGVRVSTLFQNMPIKKGKHLFWLPNRDDQNRPIPAGAYELRSVESRLTNTYITLAGNYGASSNRLDNCSWAEEMFAFDDHDRIYIAQNSFENGMGVRAFDASYTKPRWMMPGGGDTVGAATDAHWFYYLQRTEPEKFNLRRINLETGQMGTFAGGAGSKKITGVFSNTPGGMAYLAGRLYVADAGRGILYSAPEQDPVFTPFVSLDGLAGVATDEAGNRIWILTRAGQLQTVDPQTRATTSVQTPPVSPVLLSVRNGKMALLSTSLGRIFRYDCSNPHDLKPAGSIGTGDGPYGPIKPDRFWFQRQPGEPAPLYTKLNVAINNKGEIAVVDGPRVSFWAADGSLKKQGLGFWGQHNTLAVFAGEKDVHCFDISGSYAIRFDSRSKTWSPDRRWQLPPYQFDNRAPHAYFNTGGKTFGVYEVHLGDPGKAADGKLKISGFNSSIQTTGLAILRMEDRRAVPVSLYYMDSKLGTLIEQHDTNGDGIIDDRDALQQVRGENNSPVRLPNGRYGATPGPDGSLIFTDAPDGSSTGLLIRMKGLDPTAVYPIFAWDKPEKIPCIAEKSAQFTSPYDFKTMEDANRTVQLAPLSDGGYASSVQLKSSGGTGLANGAGTDIAGFAKDGTMRWLARFNMVEGTEGVQSLPALGMVLGMTSTQCDYMVLDEDGLGMGVLSMPREAHWGGMWSDHAQQQQVWIGNDGKPYYLLGDYSVNGLHWFSIDGMQNTVHRKYALKIDAARALALSRSPGLTPVTVSKPPTVKVTIPRLKEGLPMDGDLKKWRSAGIAPLTLITPETGTPDIIGPRDCSAVVRMAYQGTDLYVQTIVFDDVVSFHQPQASMNSQDGMEFIINSFMAGFKYNVAITTDKGPTVFRNRFVDRHLDRVFSNDEIPRSIKVLDNASEVEERKYIETIYGVDLSRSRVIVTEFKLPLTPTGALAGDPNVLPSVGPGTSFWIGFLINDNDIPGGDIQKYMVWPATYGNFNLKEAGALATLE
jgi:Periplasmic copper-binding protein (NosD)